MTDKVNYKIVSLVLVGVLIVTYAWNWGGMFGYNNDSMDMKMSNMNVSDRKNTHMMKMPDGSMMEMGNSNSSMDMGDMTMSQMVNDMKGKTGKDLEKAFITGMIPHHQGAVEMSKILLQDKTISPQLKAFAENIIKAQESEISQMNTWLKSY